MTSRSRIDESIERVELGGFAFPLGVYPVEKMTPRTGYSLSFEASEGGDTGVEEWPDRYVFEIAVSAKRVDSVCRALFAALQGRVYPILDVLGQDAYREVDSYVSYDLIGLDRFLDAVRRYRLPVRQGAQISQVDPATPGNHAWWCGEINEPCKVRGTAAYAAELWECSPAEAEARLAENFSTLFRCQP